MPTYGPRIPPRTFRPDAPYYFGGTDDWRPEVPSWDDIAPEDGDDAGPGPGYPPYIPPKKEEGMSTGTKVAIAGGVLLGVGVLWYALK